MPAVQALLPALYAMRHGDEGVDFNRPLSGPGDAVLRDLSGVRRSLGTVRILSHAGDTLIKVRDGLLVPPVFDHLDDTPIIENGAEIPGFREQVAGLRTRRRRLLIFPPGFEALDAVLNTTLPLLFKRARWWLPADRPAAGADGSHPGCERTASRGIIVGRRDQPGRSGTQREGFSTTIPRPFSALMGCVNASTISNRDCSKTVVDHGPDVRGW